MEQNPFWFAEMLTRYLTPLRRLSLPADEDLRVRLVWTRQEEEALKREGWKEVPSEWRN